MSAQPERNVLHERDLARGYGRVKLPDALDRKTPSGVTARVWQGVFPSATRSTDPRWPEGGRLRQHRHEGTVTRPIHEAVIRCVIPKRATAHFCERKKGAVESSGDTPGSPQAATEDGQPPPPAISVIIPTLNEETALASTLDALARMRGAVEVIVVDGGSDDCTLAVARDHGVRALATERGRGAQLRVGAREARGAVLWFLHADTLVPTDAAEEITEALRDPAVVGGNFRLRFDGPRFAAGFLTSLQPLFGWLGLVYGDAAIFVRRADYERAGGFKPFPLFEDLELVRRLRRRGRMVLLPSTVVTSWRRFEGRSFVLTFARSVVLQLLYWMGVPPHWLNRHYAPVRGK